MKQILLSIKEYILTYREGFLVLFVWSFNIIFNLEPRANKVFFFIAMFLFINKQAKLKKIEKERKTKEISC